MAFKIELPSGTVSMLHTLTSIRFFLNTHGTSFNTRGTGEEEHESGPIFIFMYCVSPFDYYGEGGDGDKKTFLFRV